MIASGIIAAGLFRLNSTWNEMSVVGTSSNPVMNWNRNDASFSEIKTKQDTCISIEVDTHF